MATFQLASFADGGVVSGETSRLVGEYAGDGDNREVIAPLDKLQDFMGDTGKEANVIGDMFLRGEDLRIVLLALTAILTINSATDGNVSI